MEPPKFWREKIVSVNNVYLLEEFGSPEAIWELTVQDFPVVVTMDAPWKKFAPKRRGRKSQQAQSIAVESFMTDVLWESTPDDIRQSQMHHYLCHVQKKYDASVQNYSDLHRWSIDSPELFWKDLISFFDILSEGESDPPCDHKGWEKYGWFPHLRLNYAENLLSKNDSVRPALTFLHESGVRKQISYGDLSLSVGAMQSALRDVLGEGDVLAAYMPNIPETVISMLACTSLGGVFTSTSCDFGVESVIDRFSQTHPKILVTVGSYQYNGKIFDQREKIKTLAEQLPSLQKIVIVDFLKAGWDFLGIDKAVSWDAFYLLVPYLHSFQTGSLPRSPLYHVQFWHYRETQGHRPRSRRSLAPAPQRIGFAHRS